MSDYNKPYKPFIEEPIRFINEQPILTIDIHNDKEVAIRIVKNGVKLRDITMGDLEKLVEYLNKKEGK